MQLLVLCILVLISILEVNAAEVNKNFDEMIKEEQRSVSLNCQSLVSESLAKCLRIKYARRLVQDTELSFLEENTSDQKGKVSFGVIRREMALAIFHHATTEWKVIILDMPVNNDGTTIRVKTEANPSFVVERISGTSFNKMTFRVTQGERRWYPYAAKWLRIPEGVSRSDLQALKSSSISFVFMRTHPHMDDIKLAQAGLRFLTKEVDERLQSFALQGISSKARVGMIVTDLIHKEHMVNLILNEHVDPDQLYGKSWSGFFENRLHPLQYEANRTVLIDFFTNGLDAFRYTCSKAKACGHFQFTNTSHTTESGKTVLGTYDVVRAHYPKANLDPVFRRGVEGFTNGLYAAVLLFDLELSSGSLPSWVRDAAIKQAPVGFVIPAVAYNGGGRPASNFAQMLTKNKLYERVATDIRTFPFKELASRLGKGKVMMHETFGYALKFLHNHEELFTPVPLGELKGGP